MPHHHDHEHDPELAAAHAEAAARLDRVRAAALGLGAWLRAVKAPPGLRRDVEAVGRRTQRALARVLRGEGGPRGPPLYDDDRDRPSPCSPGSRMTVRHLAPRLRALHAAVARADLATDEARWRSRVAPHDPRWQAVARARRRDRATLDAGWGLARDLAARAVQTAWRTAWYRPGMAVWRARMRREFAELQGLMDPDRGPAFFLCTP